MFFSMLNILILKNTMGIFNFNQQKFWAPLWWIEIINAMTTRWSYRLFLFPFNNPNCIDTKGLSF